MVNIPIITTVIAHTRGAQIKLQLEQGNWHKIGPSHITSAKFYFGILAFFFFFKEEFSLEQSYCCVLFKLLSNIFFNKEAFKNMIQFVWNSVHGIIIFDLNDGVFIAQFNVLLHKNWVLCKGPPWFFAKSLTLMQDYDGNCQILSLGWHYASFSVRIYELPLNCMNSDVVVQIGAESETSKGFRETEIKEIISFH